MNKKKNNDMANDVADKVAQQELSNNKCYPLAFKYINILALHSTLGGFNFTYSSTLILMFYLKINHWKIKTKILSIYIYIHIRRF